MNYGSGILTGVALMCLYLFFISNEEHLTETESKTIIQNRTPSSRIIKKARDHGIKGMNFDLYVVIDSNNTARVFEGDAINVWETK